jgi:hypothetical protein
MKLVQELCMEMSLPERLGGIADTKLQQSFRPAGRPWPRLLCFTAALLASGGLWLGLIALARQLLAG